MTTIHILIGGHTPNKEDRIKAILKKEPPSSAKGSSIEVYHASDILASDIGEKLGAGSLFGEKTTILVRGCDTLKSDTLEDLVPYMLQESSSSILLLEGKTIGGKVAEKHPFKKLISKPPTHIAVEYFPVPQDYEISEWIVQETLTRFGRKISNRAANILFERVGNELHTIVSELTKIDIVLPPRQEISESAVNEYTTLSRACKPWDLPPPLLRGESGTSLSILHNLFAYNVHSIQIVSALFDSFVKLLMLKLWFASNEGKFTEAQKLANGRIKTKDAFGALMAKAANESGFSGEKLMTPKSVYRYIFLPKVLSQLSNYSIANLKYCVNLLTTADWDLKSNGSFNHSLPSMERLLFLLLYPTNYKAETRF